MPLKYFPHLRSKAGELVALRHLSVPARDKVLPIFHLSSALPATFAPNLGTIWTGRVLAIDGHFNFGETGSALATTNTITQLRAAGVVVLPSLEVSAPPAFAAAIAPLFRGGGILGKSRLGDIPNLLGWATSIGLTPADIDLVIQAGHVPTFGRGVLNPVVAHALGTLQNPNAWRSVTLASSAAPKDNSNLAAGANLVLRLDWDLWQALQATVPFNLNFGDCATGNPDMTEPPGYVMGNATVSARYTRDDDWVIIKGTPVGGPRGQPMGVQYRAHAAHYHAMAGFDALPTCWGDDRIRGIVAGTATSGSRQTWVEISVNRHLELVADRLP